jgi:rRNA maturation RNase YbeY
VSFSDEGLLEYNRTYLDHDTYTDIITFDHSEGQTLSGDLLISFPRVLENAENQRVDPLVELRRVMVHGLLHLAGFKDKAPEDAKAMRDAEDHALGMFHVEPPR